MHTNIKLLIIPVSFNSPLTQGFRQKSNLSCIEEVTQMCYYFRAELKVLNHVSTSLSQQAFTLSLHSDTSPHPVPFLLEEN